MQPLTVGTAGHVDHGKTALVRALTGVDTDRLPEEKARGLTIALGFAALDLPGGRRLSLIDVPGHERLIRTMVAGASGIDLFLLTIAADDGVMPQTVEHVQILQALGIRPGVIAITKSDLADPEPARNAAAALLPGLPIVACSAASGTGIDALAATLERVAADAPPRADDDGRVVLHVDRVFTIAGAGTVVTGTLRSGRIAAGDRLRLLPHGRTVRVRGVQVHDAAVAAAAAGQRVAVNLTGVDRRQLGRGDALVDADAAIAPVHRVEVRMTSWRGPDERVGVQVHHGTRAVTGRAVPLGDRHWQLRLETPLLALDGDRVVIRRLNPPDTLGGGVIVHCGPRRPRHAVAAPVALGAVSAVAAPAAPGAVSAVAAPAAPGAVPGVAAPVAPGAVPGVAAPVAPGAVPGVAAPVAPGAVSADGAPAAVPPPELDDRALALERRLLQAGHEPLSEAELGDDAGSLAALRAAGRAVRVGRSMYAHPAAIDSVTATVRAIVDREGAVTLAQLRDELSTSRKYAQALLEHLDAARVTRRLPDDRRVLRRRAKT